MKIKMQNTNTMSLDGESADYVAVVVEGDKTKVFLTAANCFKSFCSEDHPLVVDVFEPYTESTDRWKYKGQWTLYLENSQLCIHPTITPSHQLDYEIKELESLKSEIVRLKQVVKNLKLEAKILSTQRSRTC